MILNFKFIQEEAKQQMLLNLAHTSDLYHRSKHYKNRAFLRSISTFPHHDLEKGAASHPLQFSRLLSTHHHGPEHFDDVLLSREEFLRSFGKSDINDESDEADDEDDERTPTVERSEPKFH